MGDMKTPDFDDLLAAFDIPDIDAKEAIQSAPEETDGNQTGKPGAEGTAGPSLRATASPEHYPHQQGDPSGVSVIVKNRVRPDTYGEAEADGDKDAGAAGGVLGPIVPGLVSSEPLIHNGFEATAASLDSAPNGELWSPCSPKMASEGGSGVTKQGTNVFNRLKVQSGGDSVGKVRKMLLLQQQQHEPMLEGGKSEAGPSVGMSSPFFPPPVPSSSSHSVTPHLSHSGLSEGVPHPPRPLPASQPFNGSQRAAFPHLQLEDEDSEPDLGSPLVIQESPDSPVCSPPKIPRHYQTHHHSPPLSSRSSPPANQDQKSEHIIEERDSPESPEPDASYTAAAAKAKEAEDGEKMEEEQQQQQEEEGENLGVAAPKALPGMPSRPLKVRIKTIKTSTGGITRTVTRVAGKGGGAAKGSSPSTSQSAARKIPGKPKKGVALSQQPKAAILPVSTLQDASAAMLAAASKAQNKMADAEKAKVSATAVNITKTATLPSISPSSTNAVAAGGISVRPAVQKTVNGAPNTPPSKPASIVNSTGAVISRSQSSLVEAFNKILNSKNLLPSYRPDLSTPLPIEWSLPLPANGYRCLECGDAFALERSLARHYDRRSLRIEVTCNHCAKRLVFFNKCSLLLHAREHKERGLVMQCSHLVMRPVSIEQMIGQQDTTPIAVLSPSLPASALSSSNTVASVVAPAAPTVTKEESAPQPSPTQRAPDTTQVLLPLPCKKGEELHYNNHRCPECHTQYGSKAELVAHFQEVKAGSNMSCVLCSPAMMLPNACSAAAHQRIHKHRSPHVCPECGGIAKQANFQTHLDEACLHFTRRIGYRCYSCHVVFGGLNSIKSHIQAAHCEVFHKCPSCPMAFKSGPMAQAHISTQHPALGSAQAKMIYKCVMCDTVFTQKPLLYIHFDTHLAKQKVHVFKCPDCTKLYVQKGSMLEHIKTTHRGRTVKQEAAPSASSPVPRSSPSSSSSSLPKPKSSMKTESSDGEDWGREPEEEEEEEGGDRDDPDGAMDGGSAGGGGWSCRECETRHTRDGYIAHMRKEHGKSMKKYPCRLCERSFCSAPSLRRHVRVNHEGIKRVFHCQYCTEGKRTFSTRLILEKHMRVQHGIRMRDQEGRKLRRSQSPGQSRRRPQGLPRSDGADSSSEPEGGASAPGAGSGGEEVGLAGVSSAEDAPPPPQEESGFRCVPCGFSTAEQEEFLQHIPQHRAHGSSQQCQQCGVCFASAGSLSRHRFITHRVRQAADPAQPASPGAQASHTPAPPSPGSPGQLPEDAEGRVGCRVCGRRFDKASDLSTHLRTHGMAFIAAHKTDKAPQ